VKLCFLFPGQGTEVERFAAEWCAVSHEVRRLVALAADQSGVDPATLVAGGKGVIARTEVLQPMLTGVCLGILHELRATGVGPDVVAGHSLGELSACCCAGACSAEGAVIAAAERGRLMAREAARRPGGMVALRASDLQAAEEAVAFAARDGIAALAAHNGPGHWVISGEWAALRRLATRYAVSPLSVAGAWHSPAMEGAVQDFRAALGRHLSGRLAIPFISNHTGGLVGATAELPDLLARQLTHPVRWTRVMQSLTERGVTSIVTVGPGRLLRSLVLASPVSGARLHTTDSVADLRECVEALGR
jgi:[acyl-carrier-protein] S-malonyltransferase